MSLGTIGIVGTGFVADLYMRSLNTFSSISVVKAFDIDQARLASFCEHWKILPANSLEDLLGDLGGTLVLCEGIGVV